MEQNLSRSDRNDLRWIMLYGAVAAIAVLIWTVVSVTNLFPAGVFTPAVPLEAGAVSTSLGGGASAVVTEVTVAAPDTPLISVIAAVTVVIVRALTFFGVIACILALCRNISRGITFDRANSRLVSATAITLFVGTLIVQGARMFAINGILASLEHIGEGDISTPMSFWVAYFVAASLGLVAIAFRAGERLQRETEGLV